MTWVISNLVSSRLEKVLVSLQDRSTVCAKHTMPQKSFWTHQMVLLGDESQVEACFGPFGDSCTFCVERAIGSEIVWMHPMELQGDVGHVESRFSPFGDSVSVGARLVHSLRQMYQRL